MGDRNVRDLPHTIDKGPFHPILNDSGGIVSSSMRTSEGETLASTDPWLGDRRKVTSPKKLHAIKKQKNWSNNLALGESMAMDQALSYLEKFVIGRATGR